MNSAVAAALAPVAAAAVVLPVALAAIDDLPVGVVHDDGMYTVLAKSLATGHGYSWIHVPGAPPATHFPPGYPALLSLVWRVAPVFPANVVAFKVVNACLLAIAAGALALVAKRRLGMSSRAAAAVAIAGCLAVPTLVLSTLVMSEMMFLALLIPALFLAERVVEPVVHDEHPDRWGPALALGLYGGALMLVRTHGVAFLAAVAVGFLLRRRFRALVVFGVSALVVVLPWEIWQGTHRGFVAEPMRGDYESYGNWLLGGAQGNPVSLAARTVVHTGQELFATIVGMTTAGLPTVALRLFVSLAAIAMLGYGLWRMRRNAPVFALFVAAYLAIILLWPFTPGRFLWGIWPLLVLVFVTGALGVKDWRPTIAAQRAGRGALLAGAVLVAAGYGVYTTRGYRGRWWSSIPRQTAGTAGPVILWTERNTRPTDVIATNAELMVYLYTGRQAVPVTRFSVDDYFTLPSAQSRADALRSILRSYRIDVVAIVANDSLEAGARAMASRQPPELSLRDSVPHGLIFTSMVR